MGGQIINTRREQQVGFVRGDGHSLQQGVVVAYQLSGFPTKVMASRQGVVVVGGIPMTNREGIELYIEILRRAIRHHEHLATFPLGFKQIPLTEQMLDAEMVTGQMEAEKPPTVS